MALSHLNAIDAALNDLFALHWLDFLGARLAALHREHGQPDAPEPIFGRSPMQLPFLPYDRVGKLAGYESMAVEAFNSGVKAAYRCIDSQYAGLLTALANDAKGTEAWSKYRNAAKSEIDQYFRDGKAFEDFYAYILAPAKEQLGL